MVIPLSFFLFGYLVYVAVFLIFSFFNLFHMTKYGFVSFWAWATTVSYIVITLLALFVSYFYIAQIDWTQNFNVFSTTEVIY